MPNLRFLAVWAGTVLLLLAVMAAFNLTVDPFDVFGTPRVVGFNATKPWASDYTYLTKSHQLARQNPETIVLGTSRADIGIDPASAAWPTSYRPVYNFGLPGNELYAIARNLEEVSTKNAVKNVVVLLEVEDFLEAHPSETHWPPPLLQDRLRDGFQSVLTMVAFKASIGTVLTQHRVDNPDLTPQGLTTEGGFMSQVQSDGYGALFAQKNEWYRGVAQLDAARWAGRPDDELLGPDSPTLQPVRNIMALCRLRGIHLILLLAPSHADRLETFSRLGLWPAVEAIKRSLATFGDDIEVWDFMGYDVETTENVPKRGDRASQVKWFWEPAHFKRSLGDLMLQRVFGASGTFGVHINRANIEERLKKIRIMQESYEDNHRG